MQVYSISSLQCGEVIHNVSPRLPNSQILFSWPTYCWPAHIQVDSIETQVDSIETLEMGISTSSVSATIQKHWPLLWKMFIVIKVKHIMLYSLWHSSDIFELL